MRRVIGIDIHRTFGEVVIWEDGRLRRLGRVDMTRTALEGLGGKLLSTDEVVIEATGNCMAVSRVLSPFPAKRLPFGGRVAQNRPPPSADRPFLQASRWRRFVRPSVGSPVFTKGSLSRIE